MARQKKYTAATLGKACERYFATITRRVKVTEMVDSGKRDEKGHVVLIPVPVKNTLGEEVEVTEYIIPPSMHELCAALHIDRATWSRYMGESEEFAAVGERVRERMKAWNEHEMLTRPGKDLKGILFNLTNNYGYQKLIKYQTWKDSFSVSREMMEDGKLLDMRKQPAAFMTSYNRTRELFGAALYGAAMNGAGSVKFKGVDFDLKGADGSNLFAKAHKPKVKGDTQSNMFSDAFSADALGKLETKMHLFRGDNDEILDVAPDTILIPEIADLKKTVFAAIGADKEPTTANNAFNYQYGRWNIVIWPYLNQFIKEGTSPWVLLDSKYNETYGGAVWNDRVQLEVRSTIDDNTDANVWRGRSRFNAAFNDWRFAAVGGVTGGDTL